MKVKALIYILALLVFIPKLFSQEKVTTFGIQLKPIIPVEFFNAGKLEETKSNIQFTNQPKFGLSFGMVIRKGLTKSLSIETGLNFLKRNFNLIIDDPDSSFSSKSDFSIVNYEIPVLGLVFVRLGRNMFMNVAGGVSFDFYPTPLFVEDKHFANAVNRNHWLQPSLLINLGWEYRTEKSGYIYLGASLHRTFSSNFKEFVTYKGESGERNEEVTFDLTGNYLTLDIRYFFHEDKQKKKKKIKKQKVKTKFIDPRKK
jgi:hypothetical protein